VRTHDRLIADVQHAVDVEQHAEVIAGRAHA
jgi:hypothetical protein